MSEKIVTVLQEIRQLPAKIVGTTDQLKEKQFSDEAIASAAKQTSPKTLSNR
jgi:hypothetical protein